MRFSTTSIIPSLALLSAASASIEGFEAPCTIAAGEPFNVSLVIGNSTRFVHDVGVAFGIANGTDGYSVDLGQRILGHYDFGPDVTNGLKKLGFTLSVPNTEFFVIAGPATLSASVFKLSGGRPGPKRVSFNLPVIVGDHTSTDRIRINTGGYILRTNF
ncbi:hypothetical protein VTL71DRAFT_12120 [Oculimacula yallundae]|uniref:Uncharacterized protein n=1 Tax=Oculimacula yallundae TaxID=86028 RepID=A0ABR4CSK7_9HELO